MPLSPKLPSLNPCAGLVLAALAGLGLLAAPAAAQTTINFDSLTPLAQTSAAKAAGGMASMGTTYSAQGFTLTAPTGFSVFDGGSAAFGDGETSLYSGNAGPTTLTQNGGGTFAFNGIDLGDVPAFTGTPDPVTFTGTKLGGAVVTVTDSAPTSGYQAFTNFAGFTGLTSLTFAPTGTTTGPPQFDNIKLTPSAPGAAPEPSQDAGLALTALGLGGLLLRARKRRSGVPTA